MISIHSVKCVHSLKMQSSMITLRALSRIMRRQLCSLVETSALQREQPHLISVVCGFPKDLRSKYRLGKFGDDSWFSCTNNKVADVIGKSVKNSPETIHK